MISNSTPVKILSVATAVPEHNILQSEIKSFATSLFGNSFQDIDRLLPIFENTKIKTRNLGKPLSWFAEDHDFASSNSAYCEVALKLAEEASRKAISLSNTRKEDIEILLFVSSTGISTPSLDSMLIQNLGLSNSTSRIPIWGLGCAGGVSGLSTAAKLKRSVQKRVLLVCVELCSLTFIKDDLSKSNLVATSLFGDGAAAVILGSEGDGPEILDSHSTLFDNSADVMGWDVIPAGLKVRFSRDVPSIIRNSMPLVIESACQKWTIDRNDLEQFVFHPGGAKVLQAYEDSLGLDRNQLNHAYDVLAENGNLSSTSVLFVLERHLKMEIPKNKYGLMAALGPGFSAELALFKW